jgi:hypothetical protein
MKFHKITIYIMDDMKLTEQLVHEFPNIDNDTRVLAAHGWAKAFVASIQESNEDLWPKLKMDNRLAGRVELDTKPEGESQSEFNARVTKAIKRAIVDANDAMELLAEELV